MNNLFIHIRRSHFLSLTGKTHTESLRNRNMNDREVYVHIKTLDEQICGRQNLGSGTRMEVEALYCAYAAVRGWSPTNFSLYFFSMIGIPLTPTRSSVTQRGLTAHHFGTYGAAAIQIPHHSATACVCMCVFVRGLTADHFGMYVCLYIHTIEYLRQSSWDGASSSRYPRCKRPPRCPAWL